MNRSAMRVIAYFLAGWLATVLIASVGAASILYAQGARGVCPTEDSVSCVWLGPWQGNHVGRVIVNGPEEK